MKTRKTTRKTDRLAYARKIARRMKARKVHDLIGTAIDAREQCDEISETLDLGLGRMETKQLDTLFEALPKAKQAQLRELNRRVGLTLGALLDLACAFDDIADDLTAALEDLDN